jgi:hypothetical protein
MSFWHDLVGACTQEVCCVFGCYSAEGAHICVCYSAEGHTFVCGCYSAGGGGAHIWQAATCLMLNIRQVRWHAPHDRPSMLHTSTACLLSSRMTSPASSHFRHFDLEMGDTND